jgi:hypothetical protein
MQNPHNLVMKFRTRFFYVVFKFNSKQFYTRYSTVQYSSTLFGRYLRDLCYTDSVYEAIKSDNVWTLNFPVVNITIMKRNYMVVVLNCCALNTWLIWCELNATLQNLVGLGSNKTFSLLSQYGICFLCKSAPVNSSTQGFIFVPTVYEIYTIWRVRLLFHKSAQVRSYILKFELI